SVSFSQTGGTGSISGLGSATAASGVASKTVTGLLAGSVTLTAHVAGLTDGTTSFTVAPGAETQIVITSATTNLTSGATRAITAALQGANVNPAATHSRSSVGFSQTGGTGSVCGLGSATAASGVATKTVTGLALGPVTITAHVAGLTDGTTSFTIVAGVPTQI